MIILDQAGDPPVNLADEHRVRAAAADGADGIAVTCVAPGLTATPAAQAGMPAAAFEAVRARQAFPRTLLPRDVAATVAFLASDDAAAPTGQTLCTDGGLMMR